MNDVLIVIPTLDWDRGLATFRAAIATAGISRVEPCVVEDWNRNGFTRTVNAGLQSAAAGEDVLILNDDIECFPLGWLASLQTVLHSASDIGIVAPSGKSLSTPNNGRPGEGGLVEVNSVPFWCALIRAELRAGAPFLDPDFWHYSSDTWYCWLARWAGWRLVWVRSVYLWHEHQASGHQAKWRELDLQTLRRKQASMGGKPWKKA